MRKIGLICLALVLALATLGVGYAHWIGEVVIEQEVTTGKVLVGVFGVATDPAEEEGKDVCQVSVINGFISTGVGGNVTAGQNDEPLFRKALPDMVSPGQALFRAGTYPFFDSTKIIIDSFYPSLTILEDFVITNGGTIPVKLSVNLTTTDPDGVYDHMDLTCRVYVYNSTAYIDTIFNLSAKANVVWPELAKALEGYQLHPCHTLLIWADKHLQQEAPMGAKCSMMMEVDAVQWNLYGT